MELPSRMYLWVSYSPTWFWFRWTRFIGLEVSMLTYSTAFNDRDGPQLLHSAFFSDHSELFIVMFCSFLSVSSSRVMNSLTLFIYEYLGSLSDWSQTNYLMSDWFQLRTSKVVLILKSMLCAMIYDLRILQCVLHHVHITCSHSPHVFQVYHDFIRYDFQYSQTTAHLM